MPGSGDIYVILEIAVGFIVVPWCAWVTASIFNQRTQTALLRAEVEALGRIEDAIKSHRPKDSDI